MRVQTVSYNGDLCRTGTISGMPYRDPGRARWVYVKLDPPNYGDLLIRAAEIEPVEEAEE